MYKQYVYFFIGGVVLLSIFLAITAPQQIRELAQYTTIIGTVRNVNPATGVAQVQSRDNVITSVALTEQTTWREGLTPETIRQGDIVLIRAVQSTTTLQSVNALSIFPYSYPVTKTNDDET